MTGADGGADPRTPPAAGAPAPNDPFGPAPTPHEGVAAGSRLLRLSWLPTLRLSARLPSSAGGAGLRLPALRRSPGGGGNAHRGRRARLSTAWRTGIRLPSLRLPAGRRRSPADGRWAAG